jgi:hypothetical protein
MKINLSSALALLLVPAALVACAEDHSSGESSSDLTAGEPSKQPSQQPSQQLPPSDFCKDGTIESEPSYIASTDGKECKVGSVHCVTKDAKACPMVSPYSPDFCKDGTIESEPTYIASTDGKECKLASIHCVTKNAKACPMY